MIAGEYCPPRLRLQLDIYRLTCRRLHQTGSEPIAVGQYLANNMRHAQLFRSMTRELLGAEVGMLEATDEQLTSVRGMMRTVVATLDAEGKGETDWYPDGWRESMGAP